MEYLRPVKDMIGKNTFLKKFLVVLGPENTRVQRFYPILDKHVQMAGLLIKIQLLSYMSKKRMLIGICFHTLKTSKIYHS